MLNRNLRQLNPPTLNISDEELIRYYLATQHPTYFNQLYSKYALKIYGKCLLLLKNEAAAQDATQDIFIKIFSKLSQFREKSRFSTWVYSITYNYCIDLIRKQRKGINIETVEVEQMYDLAENNSDNTFVEEKVAQLMQVLELIPVTDKTVLLMKYRSAMPVKEIADALNKSESAVKMKLKRAKNKAKKAYKDTFYPITSDTTFKYQLSNERPVFTD